MPPPLKKAAACIVAEASIFHRSNQIKDMSRVKADSQKKRLELERMKYDDGAR